MTQLGEWAGLAAHWGYYEDYDEDGLLLTSDGEEIGWYGDGDLLGFLDRVGSLGAYNLIFSGDAWESVPELCEFARVYQRWGN
jgi:hypothetical protein